MEQERKIRNWSELEVRSDQHRVQLNNFHYCFIFYGTSSSSSSLDSSLKYLTSCLVTRPLRRLAAILGSCLLETTQDSTSAEPVLLIQIRIHIRYGSDSMKSLIPYPDPGGQNDPQGLKASPVAWTLNKNFWWKKKFSAVFFLSDLWSSKPWIRIRIHLKSRIRIRIRIQWIRIHSSEQNIWFMRCCGSRMIYLGSYFKNQHCGSPGCLSRSRIQIFPSQIQSKKDSGSRIRIKELK